jgi:hypothetical protein
MKPTKKLLLAAVVISIICFTPVSAQLAGDWIGNGSGSCDFYGTTLLPWQNWAGHIPASEDKFYGQWWDGLGNVGTFYDTNIIPISSDIVIIEGRWFLLVESGKKYVGTFKMTFYTHNRVCEGEWDTSHPKVPPTTIQGHVIW